MNTTKRQRRFSQDFGVSETNPGKTDRSFAPGCDINRIVNHYANTGIPPNPDRLQNQRFGFATSKSYLEASREIAEINSRFAELPATERSRYANNPQNWIEELNTPPAAPADETPPAASEEASEPAPKSAESEA